MRVIYNCKKCSRFACLRNGSNWNSHDCIYFTEIKSKKEKGFVFR